MQFRRGGANLERLRKPGRRLFETMAHAESAAEPRKRAHVLRRRRKRLFEFRDRFLGPM